MSLTRKRPPASGYEPFVWVLAAGNRHNDLEVEVVGLFVDEAQMQEWVEWHVESDEWKSRYGKATRYQFPLLSPVMPTPNDYQERAMSLVMRFFEGDVTKTLAWWETPNPLLGGVAPLDLVKIGRGLAVLRFVREQLAQNAKE